MQDWHLTGDQWGELGSRPRPHYHNMCNATNADGVYAAARALVMHVRDGNCDMGQCFSVLGGAPEQDFYSVCQLVAHQATKDMDWKEALAGPDSDKVIAAYHLEMDPLTSTVLERIEEGHPDFKEAKRLATPGRILLDIKRSQMYKTRGVKQGFKEDKRSADGPDFNYYAHVAQLTNVRLSLFRFKRGTRRVAVKDVRTAFLQSDPYPPGTIKYICFKSPLTQQGEYFKQRGPIYGEASAPKRWEDTIAPFLGNGFGKQDCCDDEGGVLTPCGMDRGENEPCVFVHPVQELLALLYVDDCMENGEEDDVKWLSNKLDKRFDCKDLDWLEPNGPPLDYLGINLRQDDLYLYADMEA